MAKHKNLISFDKVPECDGRMTGIRTSLKMAGLVGCPRYAVVSTYQKWSKEGQLVKAQHNAGYDRKLSEDTVHHSLLCVGRRSPC